jgi:hypothetical protein
LPGCIDELIALIYQKKRQKEEKRKKGRGDDLELTLTIAIRTLWPGRFIDDQ